MSGFLRVPLDDDFPAAFVSDIRHVIRQMVDVHKARVRVIRVPHEDLAPVFDKVCQRMFMPFRPTLCGFPVEFAETNGEVQVMCVQDDNTLISTDERGVQHDGNLVIGAM